MSRPPTTRLLWLLPLLGLLAACERHETTWIDIAYVGVFFLGFALLGLVDRRRNR